MRSLYPFQVLRNSTYRDVLRFEGKFDKYMEEIESSKI